MSQFAFICVLVNAVAWSASALVCRHFGAPPPISPDALLRLWYAVVAVGIWDALVGIRDALNAKKA